MLAFNCESDGDTRAQITLDGQAWIEANLPAAPEARDLDILPPDTFSAGKHTIIFEHTEGAGKLSLSDIVIWYQVAAKDLATGCPLRSPSLAGGDLVSPRPARRRLPRRRGNMT